MVLDTSALLAVLFAEPDGDELLELMATAPELLISAANFAEAVTALEGILAEE